MKLTIDNLDGKGAIDYSQTIVAAEKFLIERQLNQPSLCSLTVAPSPMGLLTPVRRARVVVADDNGIILFTGYIAEEPAILVIGQNSAGSATQVQVSAVSDEVLLDGQQLPQSMPGVLAQANQLLQGLNARLPAAGISFALAANNGTISKFIADAGQSWSQNAGALASMARSAYRVVNGAIMMMPVGSVVHTLSEANGDLQITALEASMVKSLANDVTVCGEKEPGAYVTEFFQGDGTTAVFELTEEPYSPPTSKAKPLIDLFQEPTINTQLWAVADSGSQLSITASGLTCIGGNGIDGNTTLSTINQLEIGGTLVLEAGGVQFGSTTQGVLNGLYDSSVSIPNCFAGFQVSQAGGITSVAPLVNGVPAGSTFTPASGHMYTLRLRIYCNESQRVLQSYNSIDDSGTHTYGGVYLTSGGSLLFEVQDTTNGVASAPVVL
ncbi:MAG: hypothetical protein JOZ33_13480, partial [Acidobacteriaceae bacterium]|nr:hypothetical protein [Acidobacteriaceae bacterium]